MASRLAFMQASRRALPGSTSALRRSLLSAAPSSAKPTTALAAASNYFQNSPLTAVRWKSTSAGEIDDSLSLEGPKVKAPPMVYIAGEEMTHYVCNLIVAQWFEPYFDVSGWERYDLSCKVRDETDDQCLKDAVEAGKRIGAIFKEPTITPTAVQVEEFGLSKAFGSPNGAMRKGWNGITISRDTIHIEGIDLGKQHILLDCFVLGGYSLVYWFRFFRYYVSSLCLPKNIFLIIRIQETCIFRTSCRRRRVWCWME